MQVVVNVTHPFMSSLASLEEIETCFLKREFDTSLELCFQNLKPICSVQQNNSTFYHNSKILDRFSTLRHHCQDFSDAVESNCKCIPLMAIVIQSMFEQSPDIAESEAIEIVEFLKNFYGEQELIPFQLYQLCMNILVMKKKPMVAYKYLKFWVETQSMENLGTLLSEA